MWRAAAAGVAFVLAAASGLVTALVTQHSSRGWWVALAVLVLVGGVLQAVASFVPRRSSAAAATGAGAVAVAGDVKAEIRTRVRGAVGSSQDIPSSDGVTATGPGAVSVGGEVSSPISTDVTGTEGLAAP